MLNKNLKNLVNVLKKDMVAITVSACLGLVVAIGASNGDFTSNTVTAQEADATVLADNDVRNSLSKNTIPSSDELLNVESEHIVLEAKEKMMTASGYDDLVSVATNANEDYNEQLLEQEKLDAEAKEDKRLEKAEQEALEAEKKAQKEKAEEEARKAEEAKKAEEARKAEEAKKAEEARKAEEAKKAEKEKKSEESKKSEEPKSEEVSSSDSGKGNTATFEVTGYCTCRRCCGNYSPEVTGRESHTATGTVPKAGRTVSVDPRVIPLGSTVVINGHKYKAEDTGSAVKGHVIDIYFDSHQTALNWGRQRLEVTWY